MMNAPGIAEDRELGMGHVVDTSRANRWWAGRRLVAGVGVAILVAALAAGWWWMSRPADTMLIQGKVIINETDHYTVTPEGDCKGTRFQFAGDREVVIELASGERKTFIMEKGVVQSDNTCHFVFSGEIPVSDTYTAQVDRYELDTFERGPITRLEGDGSSGKEILMPDFVADPWDPWAN
jgi:hypothetical protein